MRENNFRKEFQYLIVYLKRINVADNSKILNTRGDNTQIFSILEIF